MQLHYVTHYTRFSKWWSEVKAKYHKVSVLLGGFIFIFILKINQPDFWVLKIAYNLTNVYTSRCYGNWHIRYGSNFQILKCNIHWTVNEIKKFIDAYQVESTWRIEAKVGMSEVCPGEIDGTVHDKLQNICRGSIHASEPNSSLIKQIHCQNITITKYILKKAMHKLMLLWLQNQHYLYLNAMLWWILDYMVQVLIHRFLIHWLG